MPRPVGATKGRVWGWRCRDVWSSSTAAPWASTAPWVAAVRSGSLSRWSADTDGHDRGSRGPAGHPEADHDPARPEGPSGDRPRQRRRLARGDAHAPTAAGPHPPRHSAPRARRLPAARGPEKTRGRPLLESGRPHRPRHARRPRARARGRLRRLHHEADRCADLARRGGAIPVESCPALSNVIEPLTTVTRMWRPPAPTLPCNFFPTNRPSTVMA